MKVLVFVVVMLSTLAGCSGLIYKKNLSGSGDAIDDGYLLKADDTVIYSNCGFEIMQFVGPFFIIPMPVFPLPSAFYNVFKIGQNSAEFYVISPVEGSEAVSLSIDDSLLLKTAEYTVVSQKNKESYRIGVEYTPSTSGFVPVYLNASRYLGKKIQVFSSELTCSSSEGRQYILHLANKNIPILFEKERYLRVD